MQDEDRVPPKRMRASDADRDAVAERLAIALTEGRLDLDEYHHRLTRAMNAVVIGDLLPLVADLPEPKRTGAVPARSRERIPSSAWKEWIDEWRWWLGGAIIMSSIWGVTSLLAGSLLPFWPLIPLGIWAAILLAAAIWPHNDGSRRR